MKKINIFDTSVASENAGDFIIMDAVNRELKNLFPNDMFFYLQTHDVIDKQTHKVNSVGDYSFIGGTNLLNTAIGIMSHKKASWRIGIIDAFNLKKLILMGVGSGDVIAGDNHSSRHKLKKYLCGQYNIFFYQKILSQDLLHSVRDSYTESILKKLGFDNVINTGCPTMWRLTEQHCATIPTQKAQSVVFTVTDYYKDPTQDQKMIDILQKHYAKVYFWPQGSGDYDYFKDLNNISNITVIGGNLWSYDALLQDKKTDLDFIGTRLHGGIRALQNKRRSIIIGIDNRAISKSKDFKFPMVLRNEIEQLEDMLNNKLITNITLNQNNINTWRSQFR